MKKYNSVRITSYAICVMMVIGTLLASCSESSPETAQDKALKLLTGTWHVSNVTVDGVNKNDSFSGFTLTFTPTAYSAVNGEPEWPTAGTWTFTDDTAQSIVRDDDTIVEITSLREGKVTLTLHWDQIILGGGRVNTTSGEFVFELSR